jgi:tetratricopeptide (TPR) repeat protein
MVGSSVPNSRHQAAAATSEALRYARFALENNRPAEAERIAADVLNANAGNREATKVLGYALIMLGRAKEAIAPLEKAARGSHDAEMETELGIALRHAGRIDDAVIALRRASKRKPPFPVAFHELGLLLASLQRFDEAIAVLRQGCEVAPMMADMVAQLGNVYYAINDRKNAANCFRRALSLNPGHYAAAEALGVALMNDHEYAQAAELFRNMVAADPANANARLSLGNCLLNLGEDDVAYACLRAASVRGPQYFGKALRVVVGAGRGKFWLRPSDADKFLKGKV